MNLPKRNSADGRCYWMKPEVQEELQPLFDQCLQDTIDGRITRPDSLWPPVVVSSEGAPFEVCDLMRKWAEVQQAEALDAEKAIAFSENLRRLSRWGEIDYYLLDLLKQELQEKYFVVTGREDDHFWDREYSLKPGIRPEEVPEPLLRFACYVAVNYKVYGMSFQYLDTNYLLGLVEKVRPDMVKKLREHGTGRLPLPLQKRKTEHFTASANDAFAVIRITARDNTEECYAEVLDYLCELLEQEDFPRSYAVEFKGSEKSYLPITGLPKKGVNQLFACAVQYSSLHPLMERYARLAMRQYERYTNLSDEQCALPGSFAVFALGMLGQEWRQLVWDYLFVLIPEEERSEWERYCKKQGQYCHLMKQQGRKWGDHSREQDPGALMPCEEYTLQDECDYFFNSLAGDFAAGEWKSQDAEEWKNGCVADLRHRPPKVIRPHSLPHLGCLTYSPEYELYAASRASGGGTIGRALLSKNPATLNWAEPSPIGYDGPPRTLCWAGHSLWVGDPTNATRIELTDRGACQDVKNWILPEDGWSGKYHCGIVADGLGRVYFSNEWYKGQIYRWENGKVTKHAFSLDGYDHLSQAVPVPGTGRITMIHAVSGKGRVEECLLELDMDTGRCRIASLPGMGEGLKLCWFTGDWLLVQGNGEILSGDFAQLINRNTREVLRIRPGMFGGENIQHIGMLTDGTVVIVTRRDMVEMVFRYPIDFWGFLRSANKPKKLEPWREYREVYPNLPIFLPPKATERKIVLKKDSLTILGAVFTPPFTLSQLAEKLGPAPYCPAKWNTEKPHYRPGESLYPGPCSVGRAWTPGLAKRR